MKKYLRRSSVSVVTGASRVRKTHYVLAHACLLTIFITNDMLRWMDGWMFEFFIDAQPVKGHITSKRLKQILFYIMNLFGKRPQNTQD